MTAPKRLFEELKTEYGEESIERIMDSMAACTMEFIDFLAERAGVSFEIMCQALMLADKQMKEEHHDT